MRRRARFLFLLLLVLLVLLAACDGRPKSATTPARPHTKPDASVEAPHHAGATPTAEECAHPPCLVTHTTIDITPYGTSNVAVVGNDVWFLHNGQAGFGPLLKRGEADQQDVVLTKHVLGTTDTALRMSQMIVENDTVYFAASNGVVSWDTKTSTLTTLIQGPTDYAAAAGTEAKRIALDKTHVYFAAGDCRIARVPKAGGKVEELTAPPKPRPDFACEYPMLTVDEANVWFTTGKVEQIVSVPKTKGKAPPQTVFSKKGIVWGLTADADNVYALAGDPPRVALYRIPKKSGPAVVLREQVSVGTYYSLESDASQLYFFDVANENRVVAAIPKSGGARRVLATFNEREQPITMVPAPSSLFLVVVHLSETPDENQARLWRVGK